MLPVALYGRISTPKQNVESQMVALRQHCEELGWEIGGEFSDCVNGSCRLRPGLKALFREMDQGSFSAVLVFKLDRLARGDSYLVELVRRIVRSGSTLVSVTEGIHSKEWEEVEAIARELGQVAESEGRSIRQRIQSGLERAKLEGKTLGRPSGAPIKEEGAILEALASGKSVRETSGLCGVAPGTVMKVKKRL